MGGLLGFRVDEKAEFLLGLAGLLVLEAPDCASNDKIADGGQHHGNGWAGQALLEAEAPTVRFPQRFGAPIDGDLAIEQRGNVVRVLAALKI